MNFYKVNTDEGRRKKYAWAFPPFGSPTKKIKCEYCNREWNSFEGMDAISYGISLTNDYFADFISCVGLTLVNETVKNMLEKQSFGSYKFIKLPIITQNELTDIQKKELRDRGYNVKKLSNLKPDFYKLILGEGAQVHEDSNIVWVDEGEDICKICGYGVGYQPKDYFAPDFIKKDSWNGSDLFYLKELGQVIFCTDKFVEWYKQHNLTGLEFKLIESRG